MRRDPAQEFNMSDEDYKFYCIDDWSKYEKEMQKIRLKK